MMMHGWFRLWRKVTGRTGGPWTCAEAFEVLQSYLDGEVDADVARAVARHLEQCVDCATEFEVYDRIRWSLALQAADLVPGEEAAPPIDPVVRERLEGFVRSVGNAS